MLVYKTVGGWYDPVVMTTDPLHTALTAALHDVLRPGMTTDDVMGAINGALERAGLEIVPKPSDVACPPDQCEENWSRPDERAHR